MSFFSPCSSSHASVVPFPLLSSSLIPPPTSSSTSPPLPFPVPPYLLRHPLLPPLSTILPVPQPLSPPDHSLLSPSPTIPTAPPASIPPGAQKGTPCRRGSPTQAQKHPVSRGCRHTHCSQRARLPRRRGGGEPKQETPRSLLPRPPQQTHSSLSRFPRPAPVRSAAGGDSWPTGQGSSEVGAARVRGFSSRLERYGKALALCDNPRRRSECPASHHAQSSWQRGWSGLGRAELRSPPSAHCGEAGIPVAYAHAQ